MYKCSNCSCLFEDGEERKIREENGAILRVCPVCGGSYYEVAQCSSCGEWHKPAELFPGGRCKDCTIHTITLGSGTGYISHLGRSYEASFYVEYLTGSRMEHATECLVAISKERYFHRARYDRAGAMKSLVAYIADDDAGLEDYAAWFEDWSRR